MLNFLWLTTISKEKPPSLPGSPAEERQQPGLGQGIPDLKNYPGGKRKDENQTSLPSFVLLLFIKNLIGKIKELEGIEEGIPFLNIKRKGENFEEFKALPTDGKPKPSETSRHEPLFWKPD